MRVILFFSSFFIILKGYAQKVDSDKVLEEGKLLYHLEQASWYATDHMLSHFITKQGLVKGYTSYKSPDGNVHTVFYDTNTPATILIDYVFDAPPFSIPSRVDSLNREANDFEQSLIDMRNDAINRLNENEDEFFTFYENTSNNFIPIIKGKERVVFILTAPAELGGVLLGNDYKLIYSKKNKLKDKIKIHKSLLNFPFESETEERVRFTVHSHVITPLISSTDICTLLLYKDDLKWDQHFVLGNDWVSIFDIQKASLAIMKREVWEKLK